jgi:hypothetical protein
MKKNSIKILTTTRILLKLAEDLAPIIFKIAKAIIMAMATGWINSPGIRTAR